MSAPISLKSLLLLVPFFIAAQAGPVPNARRAALGALRMETADFEAFADPVPNQQTENYVTIKASGNTSRGSHFISRLRQQQDDKKPGSAADPSGVSNLIQQGGVEYLTTINYQGTDVKVIVDTGSSDTWLVESDFQCLDASGTKVPQGQCNFGPTYPGSYKNSSLGKLKIAYGDGEYANGYFGKANVTIGGITVPAVQVRLILLTVKILTKIVCTC
jgi:Eukaryotic aspartyl protease